MAGEAPQAGGSGTGEGGGEGEKPKPGATGGEGEGGGAETVETLPAWAQKLIKDTRKEAQTLRGKLTPLEQKAEEDRKAQLSETQKANEKATAAEADAATARAEAASLRAETALARAGAKYPDLLVGKLPAESLKDPVALAAAIEEAKKAFPDLFGEGGGSKPGNANAGHGGKQTSEKGDANGFLRGLAGR